MILFCGIASEPPLALAIEAAQRLGVEHAVFHQRETDDCDLALDFSDGRLAGRLLARGRVWPLESFTGVYTRLIDCHALPEPRNLPRTAAFHQTLSEWLELADCRVVNRAADMASNMSKPYQSQRIAPFFRIPPTLVTNDPAEALAFIGRQSG